MILKQIDEMDANPDLNLLVTYQFKSWKQDVRTKIDRYLEPEKIKI